MLKCNLTAIHNAANTDNDADIDTAFFHNKLFSNGSIHTPTDAANRTRSQRCSIFQILVTDVFGDRLIPVGPHMPRREQAPLMARGFSKSLVTRNAFHQAV